MKVQEVISSCIMFIVSGLVLVGFTIAWFTNSSLVSVTGLVVQAVEMGHVRVALTPGGPDISDLAADEKQYGEGAQYADIMITKSPGADTEEQTAEGGTTTQVPVEFAPGAQGTVTFYVTPVNNSRVEACDIVPTLRITQDGDTWYPVVESEDGEEVAADSGSENAAGDGGTEDTLTLEELYAIAQKHIVFFKDEAMTEVISEDNPIQLTWTEDSEDAGDNKEQEAVIYWKWYYEHYDGYPLTTEEQAIYTTKKDLIRKYDNEDMQLGNNITNMKFYVTFSAR